jgi:hypothetical protein
MDVNLTDQPIKTNSFAVIHDCGPASKILPASTSSSTFILQFRIDHTPAPYGHCRSSLRAESDTPSCVAERRKAWGAATMRRIVTLFLVLFLATSSSRIASAQDASHTGAAGLLSKENSVDGSRPPAGWRPANVGQELIVHDRLRTGEDSRAAVRFSDSSILRMDELTEEEILPPQVASAKMLP